MQKSQVMADLEYYISGNNPKLLIHSGTHGDEYEVIDCVKKSIKKYSYMLPEFVFVPNVSPSAVKAKTRLNANLKDLNRIFYSTSDDDEVISNIQIIEKFNFDMMISFHEDYEFYDYYIYDESQSSITKTKILNNLKNISNLGVGLLTGTDDLRDPHLGHEFKEGYAEFKYSNNIAEDGTVTVWAYSNVSSKSILVPEIPGKIKASLKQKIVDKIFEDLLIKLA